MKKKLLTIALAFCFLLPAEHAQAGWPTFDVTKLAQLISNLVGRFQPVPQVLSRVNQVKSQLEQIQATAQGALGDLKSMGTSAVKGVAASAKSKIEEKAESSGAKEAMSYVKSEMFAKAGMTQEQLQAIIKEREALVQEAKAQLFAKAFYYAKNAADLANERFTKADEAMSSAESLHDSINANTMMVMAGNYEALGQIALRLAEMKYSSALNLSSLPVVQLVKPTVTVYSDGSSVEEKDEVDVNFN